MKHQHITIKVDDGDVAQSSYFEVWVYDTLTGKSFMADPEVIVGSGKGRSR
jgi:hypothetical protein